MAESDSAGDKLMALLDQVQQGSQDAAWEIIDRYGSHVLRMVRRTMHYRLRTQFDSQDFVQMVWASFFNRPEELARVRSPKQFSAWLAAISRNKVIDEVRRRVHSQSKSTTKEVQVDHVPDDASLKSANPTPSAVAIARERWEQLVRKQPAHVKRILEMRLMGSTYQEIADTLQLHERSVRKVIERMLKQCRSWAIRQGA
jgi:RNA polymerase sigma factor (sigma-70 family)